MESIFIIDIIHKFELDIECFNPSIFSSNQSLDLSKLLLVQSFLGIVILSTRVKRCCNGITSPSPIHT